MRTKASIKSHPIHQILIPFPIAFLIGSVVSDTIGLITDNSDFFTTGRYLIIAGIIMGLAAAVPGLIDYIFTVPPQSTGKKRATKHMIVNVSTVVIFLISLLLREAPHYSPQGLPIILQYIGAGLLGIGGWLGGTLVNRNFIGPDHRYANKGKWNEDTYNEKSGVIKVAGTDELGINQMKLLRIGNKRVVLARTEEGYSAFQDRCTHRGASLTDGILICSTVQCLWHGSQFNALTGEVISGPAELPVKIYKIETRADGCYLNSNEVN
jgi:nitrite reductase/ring-hydroxylating ferredoxin subunit/uncharacterized membrane protein